MKKILFSILFLIVISLPAQAVRPGDVLVNEIMVKPPLTGLPNKQYVELRNSTNDTISLGNWKLNNHLLYAGNLLPNGYVIVCSAPDVSVFSLLGNTLGAFTWSALNNNGSVVIRTDQNMLMDSLSYTDQTYRDTIKQSGGWSMELDTQRYAGNCPQDLFWSASNNLSGGTPGSINSKGFSVRYVHATDSILNNSTMEIDFHAPMDITEVQNINNYAFSNGIAVQYITALDPHATKAQLTLSTPLQTGVVYTFIIKQFTACAGYVHLPDTLEVAITDKPQAGEIIINEILFNPNAGGEQFVELYNKSNKTFKIKDMLIAQADAVTGTENQTLNFNSVRGYFYPNDYLVISKNKNNVKAQYNNAVLSKFMDANLPAFDTKEDVVVLKNADNVILDKLHYNEDWHFPLLTTKQGVSLERTAFDAATQNKRNWHSASPEVGYATPGYLNSENTYELERAVHIVPEIFSPDGDGVDDVATITYSFDDDGSVVNVYLYNADGRLANQLAKDVAIPKEGTFAWNGDDENGNKKDVGIYFLVFERKKTDGTKLVYKRKCVLAAKLN